MKNNKFYMWILRRWLCVILIFALPSFFGTLQIRAQEEKLADQMLTFIDDLNQLYNTCNKQIRFSEANLQNGSSLVRILNKKVELLNNNYHSIDFRWNAFKQASQADIANSEYLMELMSQVEQLKQEVSDSISSQQNKRDALVDFFEAEQLILSQDTTYQGLYNRALEFSMIQQTAPQLQKVKAEEQTSFEKIQTLYEKSKTSAQLIPQLDKRAAILDEQFYSIKALSEKIQAMEYKPPIERIKDYLLGLACVAMILLFIGMVTSKIGAVKKARETYKKQKELFERNNNNDYPTI